MDEKITSVVLSSIDRTDLGSISFALYTAGPYILERMDGWAGISSINTAVTPYQIRNGSNVSNPNQLGGKLVSFLVHIKGDTETQTIQTINRINGVLQTQMKLSVIDNGVEYLLEKCNLADSSYKLTRNTPTQYDLEFVLAADSAYRVRSETFEKVISAGGGIVSGGIIYPTFSPQDDVVSYPDYDTPYNTVTEVQQQKIVIDGNGDIYPYFEIVGNFYSVTITLTDSDGTDHAITLFALGAVDTDHYHEWQIDTESLTTSWTTPNTYGAPSWNDSPVIDEADWFKLGVGQNIISASFTTEDATGTVTSKWRERYL